MDWNDLNNAVKQARKEGDPIANIIHKLRLESNQVTMNKIKQQTWIKQKKHEWNKKKHE